MDPQSPPKRMTRARAAAKSTTEPATTRTTRIVTAATKAKATRSTATAPTSSSNNKRKTRPDDAEDEDPLDAEPVKPASSATTMKTTRPTRGRPKKAVDEPAPAPTASEPIKATRGRPKKTTEPAASEPVKTARTTRTKKTKAEETDAEMEAAADTEPEPPKKTTRGRPAAASTIASRQAARPAIKKTVKFEEPEKENLAPRLAAASKSSTKAPEPASGLRARPIRRPAAAAAAAGAGRTVRGSSAKSTSSASDKGEKPLPLSPKKVNQLTINKADSDDELAMNDKPSIRSLTRNPIKPPVGSRKAQTVAAPPIETEEHDASDEEDEEEPRHALILGTPAKRPPPSPWKNSIKSPAKRVEGVLAPPVQTQLGAETSKTPAKITLLQSPAKRIPVMKSLDLPSSGGASSSPMKMSLLSSPAKRSFTPMKPFAPVVADLPEVEERTPAPKPTILSTPLPTENQMNLDEEDQPENQENEEQILGEECDNAIPDSPTRLRFPGRLSAVLPRHADPVFKEALSAASEEMVEDTEDVDLVSEEVVSGEPMVLDNAPEVEQEEETDTAAAEASSNARSFELREKDLQPYNEETDSEDESSPTPQERYANTFGTVPATPCPVAAATPSSRRGQGNMRSAGRSTAKRVRMDDKFGFTPLADQLSGWAAGPSPLKTGIPVASPAPATVHAPSPAKDKPLSSPHQPIVENQFFEDEMMIRQDAVEDSESAMSEEGITPVLEDIPITEEDVALAAEANEMSLMEPEQVEELINNQTPDDSVSEASQEYGDENAIPIDPALVDVPPVTPHRVIRREVHTVSKIPLKPAAEESPRRKMRTRSHSISRLPVQRPTEGLNRSATVISYSNADRRESNPFVDYSAEQEDRPQSAPPVETPQKSEVNWSNIGTPARTPRRDLDPALLRGAVVFVDVHTSEGADASSIFVDLLSQMGARCVKSWNWNPSSPPGRDGQLSSKIGITHVVYKDGGKRTLEKVRETGGVVQCVGVSWVLDCERENQWLDEVPYYIDTSLVPRGGARRRKSMEPRALANLNGTLIPTPVRNSNTNTNTNTDKPSRASVGAAPPSTPTTNKSTRRRESALWIRTPEEVIQNADHDGTSFLNHDENDDDDMDWNACILTPVPKTPAPEAIARYAANINPDTPTTDSFDEEDDPLHMQSPAELMTRTCPPKAAFRDMGGMGAGILQREKDEGVLMRLMAARRKSLQFAPKIASPLSKSWY